MEEAERFFRLANDFCSYIKKEMDDDSIPYLTEMLLKLCLSAMKLPDVEPDTDDGSAFHEHGPSEIKFHCKKDLYWEIFDPFSPKEPGCGMLSMDLYEIGNDLEDGILDYNDGRINDAVWGWKFGLRAHWGDHAADALRALHYLWTIH